MRNKAQRTLRKPHRATGGAWKLDGITRMIAARTSAESILTRYDGIIVLKDGSIVEDGAFENLTEQAADFRALYTKTR